MHGRWLGLVGVTAMVAGCGTDAVGVSDCRAIEAARCNAAVACGYPSPEECRRTQRDQCLHGMAGDSVSAVQVDACVRDIERAGTCAEAQGPSTAANMCASPVAADVPSRTVCDVVVSPDRAQACAFLLPTAAPEPARTQPAPDGGA